MSAYDFICKMVKKIQRKCKRISCDVYKIENDFFGHSVTVAGLVTAGDIINQIKDLSAYDKALIPDVMLRSSEEKVFLDDISLDGLSEKLNVKITPVCSSGSELLNLMI